MSINRYSDKNFNRQFPWIKKELRGVLGKIVDIEFAINNLVSDGERSYSAQVLLGEARMKIVEALSKLAGPPEMMENPILEDED